MYRSLGMIIRSDAPIISNMEKLMKRSLGLTSTRPVVWWRMGSEAKSFELDYAKANIQIIRHDH
jgi:hypothetical protein